MVQNLITMNKYTIEKAWPWIKDQQIRITSDNLEFVEFCNGHNVQTNNPENTNEISELCKEIADRIRQIEKLNKEILPF